MKVLFLFSFLAVGLASVRLRAQPNTSVMPKGNTFCSSVRTVVIRNTYTEADGLLPGYAYLLRDGEAVTDTTTNTCCTDLRPLPTEKAFTQKLTANYRKHFNIQSRLVRYWVRTKTGFIVCLSWLLVEYNVMEQPTDAAVIL